jgi:hypothetical protein
VIFTGAEIDLVAIAAIVVALAVLLRFKLSLHWVVLAGGLLGVARVYWGF